MRPMQVVRAERTSRPVALQLEFLEPRLLLSAHILAVQSANGAFHPATGLPAGELPPVLNTYVADVSGDASSVVFQLAGQTVQDANAGDGWSATFDMSSLTSATDAVVPTYSGATLHDTYADLVNMAVAPDWMKEESVAGAASSGWANGYSSDTYVNGIDTGFSTLAGGRYGAWPPPGKSTVTIRAGFGAAEPNHNGGFTVTRTGGSWYKPLTVYYSIRGTATNGTDYTFLSGSVVIPAQRNLAFIPVNVIDDMEVEGPESVTVALLWNANYNIGSPNGGTVTIADDELVFLGSWQQGNALVSAYDVGGGPNAGPANINVKFGKGDSVASITLGGTQPMPGIGIVISGATSVGSIKDARKGTLGDLAFIASNAPVKSIQLKSGMTGYDLNGQTLGGLTFAEDIDGDGDTADATAIYSAGAVGNVTLAGNGTGDIYIGGKDSKGVALSSFSNKTSGHDGDLVAQGDVGMVSLGGDLGSVIHVLGSLSSLQITNGNLLGSLEVDGSAGKLSISGGDFLGSIDVHGNLSSFSVKSSTTSGGWLRAGSNTRIGGLLSKASATYYETDNGGEDFGIFAGSFGSVQIAEHRLIQADLPFKEGDFCVELLP